MKLTMLKSFPWYRDAYAQGKDYEVEDKLAREFIRTGLGRPADKAAAKAVASPLKVAKALTPEASKVVAPAKVADGEKKPADEEKKDDKDKPAVAKAPGKTEPYKRRDMTPEK